MFRKHSWRLCAVLASIFTFAFVVGPRAVAQAQKVPIALPTTSVGFAYAYVAESLGLWKEQGLDVTVATITGLNATNALLAGNVEFSGGSGGTLLLATSRGQKLVSIANLHNRLLVELVLSNDAVANTGLAEKSPVVDRAKALKGMTIAVDFINSIIHGYLKFALLEAGLNPESDVTVTPITPIGMLPALQSKRIDG
jgi:NitT/TauT family transport system substrate-binding protein